MEQFNLWENPPLAIVDGETPSILYFPTEDKKHDACAVIFAGGGYGGRAKHEGEGYAEYLNSRGVDAFVVNYRVSPHIFPTELLDARRAVRFVRANAEKFGINPEKLFVMGSSAGGHLAALLSTYQGEIEGEGVDFIDEISPFPNAQVLCYPVLDIEGHAPSYKCLLGHDMTNWRCVTPRLLATENTPPAFMWHCAGDAIVDAQNTLRYSSRLMELGVLHECHIYPEGRHGIGLATEERFDGCEYMRSWADMMWNWLVYIGII